MYNVDFKPYKLVFVNKRMKYMQKVYPLIRYSFVIFI